VHPLARDLLAENHDKLDALADGLLEHEPLDEDEAYEVAGRALPSEPGTKGVRFTLDSPAARPG